MGGSCSLRFKVLVGLGGLEPPTSSLSVKRSNHLSYRPVRALLTLQEVWPEFKPVWWFQLEVSSLAANYPDFLQTLKLLLVGETDSNAANNFCDQVKNKGDYASKECADDNVEGAKRYRKGKHSWQ